MAQRVHADLVPVMAERNTRMTRSEAPRESAPSGDFMQMLNNQIARPVQPESRDGAGTRADEPSRERLSRPEESGSVESTRVDTPREPQKQADHVRNGEAQDNQQRPVAARENEGSAERKREVEGDTKTRSASQTRKDETERRKNDVHDDSARQVNILMQMKLQQAQVAQTPVIDRIQRALDLVKRSPRQNEQMRELKDTLLALRDMVSRQDSSPKSGTAGRIERLADKLDALIRRLENGQKGRAGEHEVRDLVADIKREMRGFAEAAQRPVVQTAQRHHEKGADSEQKGQAAGVERTVVSHEIHRPSGGEASTSGGNDSNIGFNQFRNEQANRQTAAANQAAPKMQHFGEQLQTIMDNARIVVRDARNGSFSMNMYPESLGRVNVNLGLENGVIHGRFLVDSVEAKEMLLDNLGLLREKMEEAGISVGEFQVNVRDEGRRFTAEDSDEAFPVLPRRSASIEAERGYDAGAMDLYDGALNVIA